MSITWSNEKRRLADLKAWKRNPRQIKDKQAKRLGESFDEFGQAETLAIGPDNEVYNGHQRLNVLALKYGNDYQVDVRVASRALTEKERERLTVYLHRGTTGEWDFDTLANEFEFGELVAWGFDTWELTGVPAPAAEGGPNGAGQTFFDATRLGGSVEAGAKKETFLMYVTFSSAETFRQALELLTLGERKSLQEDALFAHIDGDALLPLWIENMAVPDGA